MPGCSWHKCRQPPQDHLKLQGSGSDPLLGQIHGAAMVLSQDWMEEEELLTLSILSALHDNKGLLPQKPIRSLG